MASIELRALARAGAKVRLEELKREEQAILAAFPDLSKRGRRAAVSGAGHTARAVDTGGTWSSTIQPARRRRQRTVSAAERRAISARMKKYWAKRRAGKAAKGS